MSVIGYWTRSRGWPRSTGWRTFDGDIGRGLATLVRRWRGGCRLGRLTRRLDLFGYKDIPRQSILCGETVDLDRPHRDAG